MPEPDVGADLRARAERILVEWVMACERGEGCSFAELLAAHPAEATLLDELKSRLDGVRSLVLGPQAAGLMALLDAPDGAGTGDVPPAGTRLGEGGRYELQGLLARGGMGLILAAQDLRLQRDVAVKLLEPVSAGGRADAHRRFLNEAAVTARLDHPGIVPVHDFGCDPRGRPFFVMKRVHGITLEQLFERVAAREAGCTVNRAVGVLASVAEAVSYAHSKGVLHRDIKPGNVMVGPFGETWLMDWGLARVLGEAEDRTSDALVLLDAPEDELAGLVAEAPPATSGGSAAFLQTREGKVLGTPVFMSPEQACGDSIRVDERSDVWSLGAMLWNLLTGRLPRVRDGERPQAFAVLLRARREPLPPARTLAPDAPPTLLAICERALAEDPADRWRSAGELAAALRDYLEDRSEAREEARRQAARAQGLLDFLLGMLAEADPARARGHELSVRELVDRAAAGLDRSPGGNPLDAAFVRGLLGTVYRELGRIEDGLGLLGRAHAALAELLGEEHPDTLSTATDLVVALRRAGQAERAEPLLRRTLQAQVRRLGAAHPAALRSRDLLAALLHRDLGDLAAAESEYRAVLAARTEVLGPGHPATHETRARLGTVLGDLGRHAEAEALLREAAEGLLRAEGEDHPATLVVQADLARTLRASGRLAESRELCERTLSAQRRVRGEDHPDVLLLRNNLGMVLLDLGLADAALAELQAVADAHEAKLGPAHQRTLSLRHNVALALARVGRHAEAEALLRTVVARARAGAVRDPTHLGRMLTNLGRELLALARAQESAAALQEACALLGPALDAQHPWVTDAQALLAQAGGGPTKPPPAAAGGA